MDVIPAIDLCGGKVVRLAQGDYDRLTAYADDAAGVARQFAAAGAKWLHVVDLDAAKSGKLTNTAIVHSICQAVGDQMKVEVGGGLRDQASLDTLAAAGVARMIVGSAALANWKWFESLAATAAYRGRLVLGLDARQGRLAVHGWTQTSQTTAVEVASAVKGWPLAGIVYTDIARDGMLEGVNLQATAGIIAATDVPVIASGGVGSIVDIRHCKRIGCAGVIVGRAYYEGRIDLAEALEVAA